MKDVLTDIIDIEEFAVAEWTNLYCKISVVPKNRIDFISFLRNTC